MNDKQDIFVDITVTNECNCRCDYCFEGEHSCKNINIEEQQRQLALLINTCEAFDQSKYKWFTISFWGGEPFLNLEYVKQIIDSTSKYPFVRYHCYSNGTLLDEYKKFVEFDSVKNLTVDRLHIQLSYDGEPHHMLKRHTDSGVIKNVAQILKTHNISFSFKATLSYDMIQHLPAIWDSYKELYNEFGVNARYTPTLDTVYRKDDKLVLWQKILIEIAKKEYLFIKEHNYPLWTWFENDKKTNCCLGNSAHMHSDGNIYICHGCAYKKENKNTILAKTSNITTLFDILSLKYTSQYIPEQCKTCSATYCSMCHAIEIDENKEQITLDDWIQNKVNNINRCKYFKYFGLISKLLKYSVKTSII